MATCGTEPREACPPSLTQPVQAECAEDAKTSSTHPVCPSLDGAQWLLPRLNSPEGTQQVLQQLQSTVAKDSFQHRLSNAQQTARWMTDPKQGTYTEGEQTVNGSPDGDVTQSQGEAPDANDVLLQQLAGEVEDLVENSPLEKKPFYNDFDADVNFEDGCVVIGQTDVVDAMADFIAQCVVLHPQACLLSPKQLQAALTKTINELQKSKCRTLWEWSKTIYKGSAWTYGVANAYTHPWLIKAVLVGIWQAVKMMSAALPIGL